MDEPEQSSLTLSSLALRQRGDYADLTVIRENLFELPEDCIAAATALMTITNESVRGGDSGPARCRDLPPPRRPAEVGVLARVG